MTEKPFTMPVSIEDMITTIEAFIRMKKNVVVRINPPEDHWNHYLLREAYHRAVRFFASGEYTIVI